MKFMLLVLTVLVSQSVIADPTQPVLVQVPVQAAYIPSGFDSNDKAQIVVEGYLPNSCYRIGVAEAFVDQATNTVKVRQNAYMYNGMCLQMIIPFTLVVNVGLLEQGDYRVIDEKTSNELGRLPVKLSLHSEPDDHLYAAVQDTTIYLDQQKRLVAKMEGYFPDTCTKLEEVRIIRENSNVVAVLPIAKRVDTGLCRRVLVPFVKHVLLPSLNKGRFLLHVRSLNGQAVNKMFNVTGGTR
ncbi:MAG TPA: hypothetical protein VFV50_19085 [Bdellovibrionales bacterium]|nr:hypothetical protein [Bdellovibrionales bacterium]